MVKKSKKSNPKSTGWQAKIADFYKRRKVLSVFIVLAIAAVLFVAALSAFDAYKINKVNQDLEELYAALVANGFEDAKLEKYCWRTSGKYGSGAEVCDSKIEDHFVINEVTEEGEYLNRLTRDFFNVINSTGLFKTVSPSRIYPPGEGPSSSASSSYDLEGGVSCSVLSTYDWDESILRLFFSCDTTPWLMRNFGI